MMRRVHLGDLIAGARLIALVPPASQTALARRLISEADAAHRYMKRFARPHPQWGTGSIETRAGAADLGALHSKGATRGGCDLADHAYLMALAVMAQALAARKPRLVLPQPHPM